MPSRGSDSNGRSSPPRSATCWKGARDAERTVDSYFDHLNRELSDLPSAQRRDLLEEIRNHVEDSLKAIPDPREADVRNVLEQLGDPEVIAEEARQRFEIRRTRPSWREWTAVVLLAGAPVMMQVYPILGTLAWITAAVLVATSAVWRARDRAIGVVAVPIQEVLILLWLRVDPVGIVPIALLLFGVPVLVAGYLGYRLRS